MGFLKQESLFPYMVLKLVVQRHLVWVKNKMPLDSLLLRFEFWNFIFALWNPFEVMACYFVAHPHGYWIWFYPNIWLVSLLNNILKYFASSHGLITKCLVIYIRRNDPREAIERISKGPFFIRFPTLDVYLYFSWLVSDYSFRYYKDHIALSSCYVRRLIYDDTNDIQIYICIFFSVADVP